MTALDRWLTVTEAAALLGRSPRSVYREIQATGALMGVSVVKIGPTQRHIRIPGWVVDPNQHGRMHDERQTA